MTLREKLIQDAEQFCQKNEISLARLSTIVMNKGGFFKSLKAGSDCTTGVYERFNKVFADPKSWEKAKEADRERRTAKKDVA